eukprot:9931734-Alexandrium_andersonii.AAC.1
MQEDIAKFTCHVHRGRFGTLCQAVLALESVERPLRFAWSLDAYQGGRRVQERPAEGDGRHVLNLADVDRAIGSPFFWGYCAMLRGLAHTLQSLMAWSEGCDCHYDFLRGKDALPKEVLRACVECPWRGRRA